MKPAMVAIIPETLHNVADSLFTFSCKLANKEKGNQRLDVKAGAE
jgi:hypothetical protein